MFLQNIGYFWGSLGGAKGGAAFRASGLMLEEALRRDREHSPAEVLFDPQLYLLDMDLSPEKHSGLLTKLASYPWFGMSPPSFDSDEQGVKKWAKQIKTNIKKHWKQRSAPRDDWAKTVKGSVQFQSKFGVTTVLLPTLMLTSSRGVEPYLDELDEAIDVAKELTELPLFASLVIDESVLRATVPEKSEVIDALADGISARESLSGVYLAISMGSSPQERLANPRVVGGLFRLCQLLSGAGLKVIVNFAESLGLVCLTLGAAAYASGYSVKDRRLAIGDFVERSGGAPYPKFFSRSLLLDLRPEDGLERLAAGGFLGLVASDRTQASSPLLKALAAGKKSSAVAGWEDRRANTEEAQKHYLQLHELAAAKKRTIVEVQKWLSEAEQHWASISHTFRTSPLSCDGTHITVWRQAFEAATK
jgi:hypothetical protein